MLNFIFDKKFNNSMINNYLTLELQKYVKHLKKVDKNENTN